MRQYLNALLVIGVIGLILFGLKAANGSYNAGMPNRLLVAGGGGSFTRQQFIAPATPPVLTRYPGNPVVQLEAATWKSNDVDNPDVFYDTPNSRWAMDYTGYDGDILGTGMAYSTDLLNWTDDPANPVITAAMGVAGETAWGNGTMLYREGTYYAYTQDGFVSYPISVRVRTSTDLHTWTYQGVALGPSGPYVAAFDPSHVLLPDGTIRLIFAAADGSNNRHYLYADSTDGITFGAYTELPALPTGVNGPAMGEPAMIGDPSGSFWLFTHNSDSLGGARYDSAYLTTDGGVSFGAGSTVLSPTGSGWESVACMDPMPVWHNGTFYLFYAAAPIPGWTVNIDDQIGVATAVWG